jgi:hypothetical protein
MKLGRMTLIAARKRSVNQTILLFSIFPPKNARVLFHLL